MVFVRPRDRVMEYSTSNSQSVFTVTGAVDVSHNAFSASMAVGDSTIGGVVEPGVAFKSGILTYSATNEVTVTTAVESKGTFSASGTKQVFMGLPAALQQLGMAQVPPYLGQVATRSFVPRKFSSTNKQLMSRSRHRAAEAISSLQIAVPNWHVDIDIGGVFGETACGAAATVTASIEYPAGTFTQVKFSGVATGNIADGATLLSDAVKVSIPQNAYFFVRMFFESTAGIPYEIVGGDDANGEAVTYAVSGLTDQTMSGTVVQTTAGYRTGPCAIVAMTQRPSIYITGASNVYGSTDTHDDTTGDIGSIARSIGPSLAYINTGIRGDGLNNFSTYDHSRRIALLAYCSHVITGLGRNDINGTAAVVIPWLQTYWALFGNKPLYQLTLEPTSTSTDGWVTTVNQTTDSNNAERILINDFIRGNPAPLTNYIEIADLYETARDSGIWKAGYTIDGVHGNATANVAVRNSRAIDASVITQSAAAVAGIVQALLDLKAPTANPSFTGLVTMLGGQIKMPATQNPSSDPNTFDDYEEGTFTPGLTFGGASVGMTWTSRTGRYQKSGDKVTVSIFGNLSAKGSSTGAAVVTGLPFVIGESGVSMARMNNAAASAATQVYGLAVAATSSINFERFAAGVATTMTDADFNNNTNFRFTLEYFV